MSGELKHIFTGKMVAQDENGNILHISNDDPRYLSGELRSLNFGKMIAEDKGGNLTRIDVNDPRFLCGELKGIATGKMPAQDKNGNIFKINTDDPRLLSGELESIFTGKVAVIDDKGNTSQVDIDDPRYLSGELRGVTTGKVLVRDEYENIIYVDKKNPRYVSGELKHFLHGTLNVQDEKGNILKVNIDDPRILSGEFRGMQYGNVFIYNLKTNESKMIKKEKLRKYIDKGWKRGLLQKNSNSLKQERINMVHQICDYIDVNGKPPSSRNPETKKMGLLLRDLKQIKKGKLGGIFFPEYQEVVESRGYPNLFENTNHEQKQLEIIRKICDFIDINKKSPTMNSKNLKTKKLGVSLNRLRNVKKGRYGVFYESYQKMVENRGYPNLLENHIKLKNDICFGKAW